MRDAFPAQRCSVVPYEGEKGSVFISYSHKDGARVYPIIERLAAEGYRVWYDEGIDPGSEWPETIADHLSKSAVCMGFISENYLNSHNCKRELNFALMKQIPFLSIMLEEVKMSAGVEMQLSTNQSIFLYKLANQDAFYKRLHNTPIMQPAFDPAQVKTAPAESAEDEKAPTAEPAKAAPVAAAAAEPENNPPAAKKAPKKAKAKKEKAPKQQKQKKEKKTKKQLTKKQKITRGILIGLASAVGLIVLLIGGFILSEIIEDVATDSTASDTNWTSLLETDACENVFWGKKISKKYKNGVFASDMKYRTIQMTEGEYDLSVLPFSIEVNPTDDSVTLGFIDQTGKEFFARGTCAVVPDRSNTLFTVTPEVEPTGNGMLHFQEQISYEASIIAYTLQLKDSDTYKYSDYAAESETLGGKASTDQTYKDIKAISLPQLSAKADCTVQFSDGGAASDAIIDSINPGIGSAYLKWTQRTKLYNGEMQNFTKTETVQFYYFNTAPYGFIMVDSAKNIYLYQDPFTASAGTDADEAESATAEDGTETTETQSAATSK